MIPPGMHNKVPTSKVDSQRQQEESKVNADTKSDRQQRQIPKKADPRLRRSKQDPSKGPQNIHPTLQPLVANQYVTPFPPSGIPLHMVPTAIHFGPPPQPVKTDSNSANPYTPYVGQSIPPLPPPSQQASPEAMKAWWEKVLKSCAVRIPMPVVIPLDKTPKEPPKL
ncbi:hypothetical protein F4811DRAFT_261736 [Daldinia bambusicola]|nr:hypothetical protein F4811DRAFT_261736 [Daldinia bambusicola]